jgi:UDP-2-acetamido-3-amino-2,3-dideoxy-glucuronate N-acetyltransferase
MILALAGEDPESLITTGGNYLHRKIADVTNTNLDFPSGIKAHIFVSWLHPFKEQKLVVVGDRKMAVFDDTQPWENKLLLYPHKITWQKNMPVPTKADPETVNLPEKEPLQMECQHFLDCISNGTNPTTDGEEGLKVLKVLNASQKSLNNNGQKVTLRYTKKNMPESNPGNASAARYEKDFKGPDVFVHQSAVIDEDVSIGKDTKIWHFSHLMLGSKIGTHCNIGQNVVIGPDVTIGDGCKIQNNVSIFKGITLEDNVFCGPSIVFTNIRNPRAEIPKMDQVRPTVVKRGATIGANATIVCGNTLGSYCFVGAGAVVTRDVKDYALVIGNPAKQIGWVCKCGERLSDALECEACGISYARILVKG